MCVFVLFSVSGHACESFSFLGFSPSPPTPCRCCCPGFGCVVAAVVPPVLVMLLVVVSGVVGFAMVGCGGRGAAAGSGCVGGGRPPVVFVDMISDHSL